MLATMSVEENLRVAADRAGAATERPGSRRCTSASRSSRERRALPASSLSGGEQQMLAIARALVMKPRVLLLDEPSMGLAPKLVDRIFEIISRGARAGTTILLVEQNARKALAIADDAYVLERGTIALSGTGRELLERPEVTAAYLGES